LTRSRPLPGVASGGQWNHSSAHAGSMASSRASLRTSERAHTDPGPSTEPPDGAIFCNQRIEFSDGWFLPSGRRQRLVELGAARCWVGAQRGWRSPAAGGFVLLIRLAFSPRREGPVSGGTSSRRIWRIRRRCSTGGGVGRSSSARSWPGRRWRGPHRARAPSPNAASPRSADDVTGSMIADRGPTRLTSRPWVASRRPRPWVRLTRGPSMNVSVDRASGETPSRRKRDRSWER
jgi:hypothetical protein